MPLISGPELDKFAKELRQQLTNVRRYLYEELTKSYPYGAVKLSPTEQLERFRAMTRDDWIRMTEQLEHQYQGMPNQHALVERDINRFVERMRKLEARMSQGEEVEADAV